MWDFEFGKLAIQLLSPYQRESTHMIWNIG
jgi:hypothetical protein